MREESSMQPHIFQGLHRTLKIPVHHAVTKHKLTIFDSLTARTTYGVWIWSKLFKKYGLGGTYEDRRRFYRKVKHETKLGTMVQCCFDTAGWMWKGYRTLHKNWENEVMVARRREDQRKLRKLLQREPQEPFTNGMIHKVPIWFDDRFGSIEKSKHMGLCPYVVRVSTLHRGVRVTVPLNPARYQTTLLEQGKLKSFQLVKRNGRYFVHVNVECAVPSQPVFAVRGIDLGVKRSIASVTLRPNQPLRSSDFTILRDGLKRNRLNQLNMRIKKLQQARKWEALKRIRHKRLCVGGYYDRLAAKQIAMTSQNSMVVVGYPKNLKYNNFRGNGKPKLRRAMTGWSYGRMIRFIQEECTKQGISAEVPEERWSSRTCHRCGSTHTERLTQSVFHCWDCELVYNADYNAAINIGSPFLPMAMTRRATDDLAYARDEPPREIVGREPRSPQPSGVWS